MAKRTKVPTKKQVEAIVASRVRIPPVAVTVKTSTCDSTALGDLATCLHGNSRFELATKLRMLAEMVGSTEGRMASGTIVLLLRSGS